MARTAALARTAAPAPTAARAPTAALAVMLALVLGAFAAAPSPAAAGSWSPPFRLTGPSVLDVIPAQLAFSPTGAASVGFGLQDEDNPASSDALTALRAPNGRIAGQRRVPGAQQVLDLAYDGPSLELLVGASPRGLICCSSVQALRSSGGGRLGRPHTLLGGLTGATLAHLVALPGKLLAAVATEHGVWVSQSGTTGLFNSTHRLTPPTALPEALAATSLPGAQSIVAWTALSGPSDSAGPPSIYIARGSAHRAPQGARAVVSVPAGHRIDELAVAPGPRAPTVAWIESWYDPAGGYHSATLAADLDGTIHPHQLSAAGELAYGLAFAGDLDGRQAIAWGACASAGTCVARGALRPAGQDFGAAQTLGGIDTAGVPAVAVGPAGEALLGWVADGHVLAVSAPRSTTRLGSRRTVSGTGFAADLTLAFGPLGQALAVWTQGTLAQSLLGAVFSGR